MQAIEIKSITAAKKFLQDSEVGEIGIYHKGFLPRDRHPDCHEDDQAHVAHEISRRAEVMFQASGYRKERESSGHWAWVYQPGLQTVALFQKKVAPEFYYYFARRVA